MNEQSTIVADLQTKFAEAIIIDHIAKDATPTFWISKDQIRDILSYLKVDADKPYRMLYDLTAIDERLRTHRQDQPQSDFTVVYHLLSFDRNEDIRIKVPLVGEYPSLPSITDFWPAANWYEREMWELYGINIKGHDNLKRFLLPDDWDQGHPMRKNWDAPDFVRLPEIGA